MLVGGERLAIDIADAQALKSRAASGDPESLRSAARQFESLLIAQMFKTMRETRFSDEDDPMTGGEGVKLYRELLDQQWAARLSAGRGLGFAEMMVKAMESRGMNVVPASDSAADAPPTGSVAVQSVVDLPMPLDSILPPAGSPAGSRKQAFLEAMKPHAEAASAVTGVPSRFILAHAALESGWGEREIRGEDGASSHNLFGIKAGRSWDGASVEILTTEYRQGVPMKMTQNFRSYADYSSGFIDYASLLKSRYSAALAATGDGKVADSEVFANGLAAGGYATDPAYAGKLKAVIASVAMAGG